MPTLLINGNNYRDVNTVAEDKPPHENVLSVPSLFTSLISESGAHFSHRTVMPYFLPREWTRMVF